MLTPRAVRKVALALPEAEERDHWGKPSFRVRGRIFATLWIKEQRAVLKLSLDEQDTLAQIRPDVFAVTPWGHQGWTSVELRRVERALFAELLTAAWRRLAPRRAVALWDTHPHPERRDVPRRPARRAAPNAEALIRRPPQ